MARIESFNEQQSVAKKNLKGLTRAWRAFISLDKFTKGAVVSLALVITATPLIVSTIATLSQNADTSIATAPAIYFGVSSPGAPDDMKTITQFENDAGRNVSIISFSENWGDRFNLFYPATMDNARNHGSIPLVVWLPKGPQSVYSPNGIVSGLYDAYITKFALEAKAWKNPFFLEFAPDMNESSIVWSNNPEQYIAAWKHIHDIFAQNNVTNVTWVWTLAVTCSQVCSADYQSVYPGDTYVDWIGMDVTITDPSSQTFATVFTKPYADLLRLAPTKPMIISSLSVAETSQQTGKSAWILDAYTTQLPNNFPNIKAVVWNNITNSTGGNFSIESSTTTQQVFAKAVSSSYYMPNVYSDIVQSPIPPVGQYVHPSDELSVRPSIHPSIIFPTK